MEVRVSDLGQDSDYPDRSSSVILLSPSRLMLVVK